MGCVGQLIISGIRWQENHVHRQHHHVVALRCARVGELHGAGGQNALVANRGSVGHRQGSRGASAANRKKIFYVCFWALDADLAGNLTVYIMYFFRVRAVFINHLRALVDRQRCQRRCIFVFNNAGTYRFSVHKNGGGFLCYVNPGQVVATHCSDISSGAGVWHVSGQDVDRIFGGNDAEVLNSVGSGYAAAAMLTTTKAVCAYRNISTTRLEVVVLNFGSASGLPVEINAEASADISIDAQTGNQATVVYKTSTGVTKGYVINISGSTPTPGAVRTIDSGTGGNGTSLAALSSTQLLCLYQGSASGTPRERILDISASTIAESAEVVADPTTAFGTYLSVKKVSAAKALVCFKNSATKTPLIRLQTITGSVPAPSGSVITVAPPGTPPSTYFGLVVMSASRAVLIQGIERTYGDMLVSLVDISGSSPVLLANKMLSPGTFGDANFDSARLGPNAVYLTWSDVNVFGVRGMVITITGDDRIIEGVVADKLEPGVSNRLACAALDATHVMQVCGNADTYLSAKTIEIAV